MMAKAQGLSLNMTIIAVLGLAVLFILITMLVTKSRVVSRADTCENAGGMCVEELDEGETCEDKVNKDGYKKWFLKKCPNEEKPVCCYPTE